MKKQFFSLALFAAAWLAGGSAFALDQDDGYYLIGSKADLQAWTEISGYEDVDFMLCTNSASFEGIFDGQGHTITLNIDTDKEHGGLFYNIKGTVKNLIVGGTFVARNKNCGIVAGYSWASTTKFENVVSIAEMVVNYTANPSNGGFLGITKYDVNFTNCISTIKVTGNQGYNHGFVGWMSNGKAYINNCVSIVDVSGTAANGSESFGNHGTSVRFSISNSYAVKTSADQTTPFSSWSYTTAEELASGKIAYNINTAARSNVLFQTLGSDAYPVPFNTHGIVYASGRKHCDLTDYEGVTYNNTSGETIIDSHVYSDFHCSYCGIYQTDYKTPDGEGYYELGTVDDVEWFAGMVNEEHQTTIKGKLTADIDFTNVTHTPIGPNITYKYNGIFDGQGHRIKNMIINNDASEQGFFGVIRGGTIIRNLIIDSSCYVTGTSRIGGLVGSAQVNTASPIIIENCINEATVNATGGPASGILGAAQGGDYPAIQINNCLNTGDITGTLATAFCAWNNRGGSSMTNCVNTGTITGADKASDKFTWYCQLVRFEPGTLTMTNCYDLSGFDGGEAGQQGDQGSLTTSAPLSSGEVCYKLGAAWTQVIGTDDYPVPVGNRGQVILNGTYQNTASTLTLNDANSFGTNSDFDVTSVTMTRTLKGEKWNTFCVPFGMTSEEISAQFGADAKVKELSGARLNGENYNMTFSDASTIVAGKPYMVRVSNEVTSLNLGAKTIKGTITPATADDVTFTGVYNNGNAPLGSFIISNNVFYLVDTDTNTDGISEVALKAFRGYITVDSGSGVKALNFDFEDDATGIENLNVNDNLNEGAIYNLSGQRINKMQKGINIINGKKILK